VGSLVLLIYHFSCFYLVKALNSFKWLNSIKSPRLEGYIILYSDKSYIASSQKFSGLVQKNIYFFPIILK
jgi:hypothetical protein